jgi:hypothetical protein
MTVQELINNVLCACGSENPETTEVNIWSQASGWPNYTIDSVQLTHRVNTPETKLLSIEIGAVYNET